MINAELHAAVERFQRLLAESPTIPFTDEARVDRLQLDHALAEIVSAAHIRPSQGFRPAGLQEAVDSLSLVCEDARPIPLTPDVRISRSGAAAALAQVRQPGAAGPQPRQTVPKWRRLRHIISAVILVTFVAQRISGPGTDQPSVEEVVTKAHTSNDPAVCSELLTPQYVEQTAGFPGVRALSRCVERVRGSPGARSVTTSNVRTSGNSATVEVETVGDSAEGLTKKFRLERVDGRWVIAELLGVEVDRDRYLQGLREHLTRGRYRLAPDHADCMVRRVGERSSTELERMLGSGKLEHRLFGNALVGCDRAAVLESFKETYREPGVPYLASARRCFSRRLERASDRRLVEYLYGDPLALTTTLLECGRTGYIRWYREVLSSERGYPRSIVDCALSEYSELDNEELAAEIISTSLAQKVEACEEA